jgi:large subunit ribosomal protein L13
MGPDARVSTKTYTPRPRDIERKWYVVDADGAVLGRLATEVAAILRGKHKPMFAPHMDTGDHVIVVNAAAIRMTGAKAEQKVYYRHSGYPGGLREQRYSKLLAERPTVVVEKAVRGMLPKTRLGRQMLSKLAVYAGPEHPHAAQKPEPMALGQIPSWDGIAEPKPKKAPKPPKAKADKPATASASARKGSRSGAASSSGRGSSGARSGAGPRARSTRSSTSSGSAKRGSGAPTGRQSRAAREPKES